MAAAGFMAAALAVALASLPAPVAAAIRLPERFAASVVLRTYEPTALAFAPGRRLLVATKGGRVLALERGLGRPRRILDLRDRVCREGERGLVGLAVDPRFSRNRFIYVFYTRRRGACGPPAVNRLSRFVVREGGSVDPESEHVLLDRIPSPSRYHVGGDVQFGKDGLLYVAVGDGMCYYAAGPGSVERGGCAGHHGPRNPAAREPNVLLGKILRVDRDGRAPRANGAGQRCALTGRTRAGARCREIFASGLRNPFRMAFDPTAESTRFFINDVGEQTWEEVNLGRRGADYGWNLREGRCPVGRTRGCAPAPPSLTDPIYTYRQPGARDHARGRRGCEAITGGAFVPHGSWPRRLQGDYLFADYVCGRITRLVRTPAGYRPRAFASRLGRSSAVHLAFGPGPDGTALFFTSLAHGGEVMRIDYARGNRRPIAEAAATPSYGAVPLEVAFDASPSSDPDGDALEQLWDFGDGASLETGAPRVRHVYAVAGVHRAVLRVRDAHGAVSDPLEILVHAGNTPPGIAVTGVRRYRFGERLTLTATATDEQDGPLDGAALRWRVDLRHEQHTHPYATRRGPRLVLRAPRVLGDHDPRTTFLRVRVSIADSWGLRTTVKRDLRPLRRLYRADA